MGYNAKVGPQGKTGFEKIRCINTNQGASGIGRSASPNESVYCFIGCSVEGFLDAPLPDLSGQILQQPVWKMMGAHADKFDRNLYWWNLL